MAILAVPTERQVTVGALAVAMALVIVLVHGIEVARQVATEAGPENVIAVMHARAIDRAVRVIDLAAPEIAAVAVVGIGLGVATREVLGIVAASEIVLDTAAAARARVATGALRAWVVRVVVGAALVVAVSVAEAAVAVAVAAVVVAVVVEGSEVKVELVKSISLGSSFK